MEIVGTDGQPLTSRKAPEVVQVIGGKVQDKDPELLTLAQFDEIAVSLIEFFGSSNFPEAPITSLVDCECVEASGHAGSSEILVRINFSTQRQMDWYTKIGMLAKILAENATGKFPRKVSMVIRYDELHKSLRVALEIACFQVRMGIAPPGKNPDKLDPEDITKIN